MVTKRELKNKVDNQIGTDNQILYCNEQILILLREINCFNKRIEAYAPIFMQIIEESRNTNSTLAELFDLQNKVTNNFYQIKIYQNLKNDLIRHKAFMYKLSHKEV